MTIPAILPRFIRLRDAPAYLGMDRHRFNSEVRVRPLTAQEIVLYKEPYVDDGMRTMRRASVGGTGWGAKPAKKRAAVAQPRAADRTSPAT
jgi:hypothetical protein